MLLGEDNDGLLINVGVAVILLSMITCAAPALVQDRALAGDPDS